MSDGRIHRLEGQNEDERLERELLEMLGRGLRRVPKTGAVLPVANLLDRQATLVVLTIARRERRAS